VKRRLFTGIDVINGTRTTASAFGHGGAGEARDRRTLQLRRMQPSNREKGEDMERSAHRYSFSILAVLALIAGCVTVNVYFPAAQVEKTAEKIVEDVYQEKKEPAMPGPTESRSRRTSGAYSAASPGLPASGPLRPTRGSHDREQRGHPWSEGPDRPAAPELLPFYQQARWGSPGWFFEVRGTSAWRCRRWRPEEAGRRRQRRTPPTLRRGGESPQPEPEQVPQIRQIFAKQWRDKAQAGWAVQADDGQWGRK